MAKPGHRLITGRLSIHRDGFGFLIPDEPVPGVDGDIFLPPAAASKGMHGDRAAVRITRRRPGPSGGPARAEGEIAKILDRANQTVVGKFHVRRQGFWLEPHESRIQQWIHIPARLAMPPAGKPVDRIGVEAAAITSPEQLDGMVVNVEIIEFPSGEQDGVGRVIEVLGKPDDFGVDVEIMIRKHRVPHHFPPDVLDQAQKTPASIPESEVRRRQDFRDRDIVTIDGETARDFDDAVRVVRLPSGNFSLEVHIADVSFYVRPGTPMDLEAARRGTSVYFPDRAVPMLPLELSTEICSLKPKVDRLVLSALLEIDPSGDIVAQSFTHGVIRSAARMTYTAVNAILEGDPALRREYEPLVAGFELMRELALLLNRRRVRRGSIDFDLPEPLLEFDEFGEMIGISRAPRNIAHRLIEEFMLLANEAVAVHLAASPFPSIYRIHETPDPAKVLEFEQLASQFGAGLNIPGLVATRHRTTTRHRDGRKSSRETLVAASDVNITSRHYQKLIQKLEGKPEERILNYLMLRSLKQARYSAENEGHFALASSCYTHFTSPIRRYPDLLVHRILSALLQNGDAPYRETELVRYADDSSKSERTAAEAERELVEWKKSKFMMQHLGDEFDGLVIATSKYGLHVELDNIFVEGFVPVDSIPGDRFAYHEGTRRIVGTRTRREYSIGDRAHLRLDRIDPANRLEFSLLAPESGKKGGAGAHRQTERR